MEIERNYYDARLLWFEAQVQAALNDPRPAIADKEVKARFAAKRAALRKRIQAKA